MLGVGQVQILCWWQVLVYWRDRIGLSYWIGMEQGWRDQRDYCFRFAVVVGEVGLSKWRMGLNQGRMGCCFARVGIPDQMGWTTAMAEIRMDLLEVELQIHLSCQLDQDHLRVQQMDLIHQLQVLQNLNSVMLVEPEHYQYRRDQSLIKEQVQMQMVLGSS